VRCLPARSHFTVTPLDRGIVCSNGPCWSPDGRTFYLARTVGLPVENATSVIFGGPNLDIAYVTSMARVVKRVRQREREAGGLFAVYGLGVRGIPEPRFRG
jgi:sugar lactone lactonase YvrE